MSSKTSVRNFLASKDTKSVKSKRSSRSSSDVSKDNTGKLLNLASKIGGNVRSINTVKRETVEFVTDTKEKLAGAFKHNRIANQERKLVTFEVLVSAAPKNTWIAYELNRLYKDKDGQLKYVFCKSAFYKGSYQVTSASTTSSEKITENKVIVRAGNRDWHLSKADFREIYIYKCTDYINMDFAKHTEKILERYRSKSLGHDRLADQPRKDNKTTPKAVKSSPSKEGKRTKRLSGGATSGNANTSGNITTSSSDTTKKLLRRPKSLAH